MTKHIIQHDSKQLALMVLVHWERLGVAEDFILENYDFELRDEVLFSITDAVTYGESIELMEEHPLMKALFLDYILKRGVSTKTYQEKLRKKREAETK